jgi:DNA helicase II / ATP-dependent DNA helicase PcrA
VLIDRNSVKSGMKSLGLRRWVQSSTYIALLNVVHEAGTSHTILDAHAVHSALEDYSRLLAAHQYFDYANILLECVAELETNVELQAQVRNRVKYLTVDEYQDVNPIQERLIRKITDLGANLCVVGDDDQNVYQWRGSDLTFIVDFADRYPSVTQIPLATNFRSTSAIVSVARHEVEVNEHRLTKDMQSGSFRRFRQGDLLALSFPNPDQEAAWIADKIVAMRGEPYEEQDETGATRMRGLSWSDCAILLRTVRRSGPAVMRALNDRGIPSVVTGMTGLFDTREAAAAVGIFRFMILDIDERALSDLWRAAAAGVTETALGRGAQMLSENRKGFGAGKRFSTYSLQRTFQDFLEAIELREEAVPGGRGEIVYYNLGKFSQVISDFEEIHYKSDPFEKYQSFVAFLRYNAPDYYSEGGQDAAYAQPDAVRIMTVHQAKGMEYPVVFLPCLQRNRFPSKRQHNRVWDYLPREAVFNAERYDTQVEDERRLLYVAITRSEKYLYASWAPDPTNQQLTKPSTFFEELTRREQFLTRDPLDLPTDRISPEPRRRLVNVELSFSDLKYFFECPYQFKLRFLYGFNPPIHEALGYGRSLHNALAEIHRRALEGDIVTARAIPALLDTHLQVRYAYPELAEQLRRSAEKSLDLYLKEYGDHLDRLLHAEETVELTLKDGVVVTGRIDLIKNTDTGQVSIVDFKSSERAQAEDITSLQLHVYALGYEQRFGSLADLLEIHNLDEGGSVREKVDEHLIEDTIMKVSDAGQKLRDNEMERLHLWCPTCDKCDFAGVCRSRPVKIAAAR